ncbi:hypothetical protein DSO57_1001877 [Entomophthora muscae]|uniref:Uncharacterized protein n=1 Tax=Entomophthora muscae TaxID=34485 RepID=A0ACC2TJI0_9FUNG|nr:hypothetical protein DSO57_1001877 [Entomophthora muscae]
MAPKHCPVGCSFSYLQGPRLNNIHDPSTESSQTQGSTYHQMEPKCVTSGSAPASNKSSNAKWPPANILEYSDKYVVQVEIPGFQRKGIAIDFDDYSRTLAIKGTWTTHQENDTEKRSPATWEEESNLPSASLSNDSPIKVLGEWWTERNFESAFVIKERIHANKTSVVWRAGCFKNKAELHPLCPFTASHLDTRPGILADFFLFFRLANF